MRYLEYISISCFIPSFEDQKDNHQEQEKDSEPDDKGQNDGMLAFNVQRSGKI